MYRLFTLEEATTLLPVVDCNVGEMQEAIRDMNNLRELLKSLRSKSLQAQNLAREIGFLVTVIRERKVELDKLGVQLHDIESGLVDFPSQLGAEMILLTWERGQNAITHFKRMTGDSTPQPLPHADNNSFVAKA
ncbi:MAG: DUF2203 domain-containing protein [Deinococcales bacterium]|jgi:hypothetical protein|nr:DUF2203 domain-containing protein [Deinococcales bacterium]|tara:strand:+ start:8280 stop:8681 length:402 start_codon:yes stop_codon:yes gene_type:complete